MTPNLLLEIETDENLSLYHLFLNIISKSRDRIGIYNKQSLLSTYIYARCIFYDDCPCSINRKEPRTRTPCSFHRGKSSEPFKLNYRRRIKTIYKILRKIITKPTLPSKLVLVLHYLISPKERRRPQFIISLELPIIMFYKCCCFNAL
jgi:hypothetical protein